VHVILPRPVAVALTLPRGGGCTADTATTLHDAPDRTDDAVLLATVNDACLGLRHVVSGRIPAQLKLLEMNLIPVLLYLLADHGGSLCCLV
jgi:hypothetical protein